MAAGKKKEALETLASLHGHTAAYKGLSTWYAYEFGEVIKQSCGGHGYLNMSGLTRLHKDSGVGLVTAEGDNTVMT